MKPLVLVFSSLSTLLLVPLTNFISRVTGAIDRADGGRKIHERDTPRLGGLAIFLTFFVFSLIALPFSEALAAVLCGGSLIVAAGVADDTYGVPPLPKLALQFIAATAALSIIEIPTTASFFGIISFSVSGVPAFLLAAVRIVFMINAVNFADGLDGLAGGLSMIAFFSLFILGISTAMTDTALISLAIFFSIFGFIPHNSYRATAFMGDSGSQFLGFSFAVLSLVLSDNLFGSPTSLFLAIPIVDVWYAVIRRILSGKSPFSADKGHIHHALISHGVPHPDAVRLLVISGAIIAALGLTLALGQA